MKRTFTLITMAIMVMSVYAETLIDFKQSQTQGIIVQGTTTIDAVKINTNTTSIPGIKFANSYTKDGVSNGNNVKLFVEGGFKAGDVLTIAGAYNNADTTKISAVDVFTLAYHPAVYQWPYRCRCPSGRNLHIDCRCGYIISWSKWKYRHFHNNIKGGTW